MIRASIVTMILTMIVTMWLVAAIGGAAAAPPPTTPPASRPPAPILLWPDRAPDTTASTLAAVEKTVSGMVENVSRPTMQVFPPAGKNTGIAVLVFPGGGYRKLAIELEGTEMCDWLVANGITCVLVKYRVPKSGPYWDPSCKCHVTPPAPLALQDAQRAIGQGLRPKGEVRYDAKPTRDRPVDLVSFFVDSKIAP